MPDDEPADPTPAPAVPAAAADDPPATGAQDAGAASPLRPAAEPDAPAWTPAPPPAATAPLGAALSGDGPAADDADDDEDDEDDEEGPDEDDPAAGGRRMPSALGGFLGAAVALAVVQGVQLAGVLAQAAAIETSGPEALSGDLFHRVGYAFLSNVGITNALALLVAVALAMVPGALGHHLPVRLEARRNLAIGLAAGLSVVVAIGAVLAARARLHVIDLRGEEVTPLAVRALVTYLTGSVGTAAIALGLAMRATRRD